MLDFQYIKYHFRIIVLDKKGYFSQKLIISISV